MIGWLLAALFGSAGLAILFAGHSLAIVGRAVIGWTFAIIAAVLALALALAIIANYLASQTGAPHALVASFGPAIICVLALAAAGVAIHIGHNQRVRALPPALPRARGAKRDRPPASVGQDDAAAALVSLGERRGAARRAIAEAALRLGADASVSDLVRAALRRRA